MAQDEAAGTARRLGAGELFGKASCAARARLPWLLCRRRTVRGVAAYFDLITDDGRLFFGDSFHFGFFPDGRQTLAQALDAHTDLVCELAGIRPGMRVLDAGCGIGGPARRIASRIDCEIVGVNISREQVRQGRELIARAGLAARVDIRHGNVLHMALPDGGFDAAICLEVAGDICVRAADKPRLLAELRRVLRPGGQVGFSDLVFDRPPAAAEDRALRALLYHSGQELLTDWPGLFAAAGFQLGAVRDIQAQTLPTWQHVQAVYRQHAAQVQARYGPRLAPGIARRIDRQVTQAAAAIERCGSYPAFSATAPGTPPVRSPLGRAPRQHESRPVAPARASLATTACTRGPAWCAGPEATQGPARRTRNLIPPESSVSGARPHPGRWIDNPPGPGRGQ